MKKLSKELSLIWNGWINAKNPTQESQKEADAKITICNSCEHKTVTNPILGGFAKAIGLKADVACSICSCPIIAIAFSKHKDCPKGYFDTLKTKITDFADSTFIQSILSEAQALGLGTKRNRVSIPIKNEYEEINNSIILISKNDINFKKSAYLVCQLEENKPSLPITYEAAVIFLENGTYRGEAIESGTLLIVNNIDVIIGTVLIKILV